MKLSLGLACLMMAVESLVFVPRTTRVFKRTYVAAKMNEIASDEKSPLTELEDTEIAPKSDDPGVSPVPIEDPQKIVEIATGAANELGGEVKDELVAAKNRGQIASKALDLVGGFIAVCIAITVFRDVLGIGAST